MSMKIVLIDTIICFQLLYHHQYKPIRPHNNAVRIWHWLACHRRTRDSGVDLPLKCGAIAYAYSRVISAITLSYSLVKTAYDSFPLYMAMFL